MKSKGRLIVLVAAIFLCSGYSAHAQQGLRSKGQLTVFDAKGKRVGQIIGFLSDSFNPIPSFPVVAFVVAGRLEVVGVTRNGFVSNGLSTSSLTMFRSFESNDCSGTLFLSQGEISEVPPDLFGFNAIFANKLYVLDGPPRSVFINSFFADLQGTICVSRGSELSDAVPTRVLVDLGAEFTPPFTVR